MKKGFTLIELLVVVLIIGILSAVALPQYTLAVQKTRSLRLLPLLRAISDAQNVHRLETGDYTLSFSDLIITLPEGGNLTAGGANGSGERLTFDEFVCWLRTNSSLNTESYSVYCDDRRSGAPSIEKYFSSTNFICWGASGMAQKVCRSVSSSSTPTACSGSSCSGYHF